MNAADLRHELVHRLTEAGRKHPHRQADLLLRHCTGESQGAQSTDPVNPGQRSACLQLLERILEQALPVELVLGATRFMGLALEVSRDVIIPDPETERLVTVTLEQAAHRQQPLRLAEVGTGCGAVAVALATRLPTASVVATDIDPHAVELARRNVTAHGLERRVEAKDMIA